MTIVVNSDPAQKEIYELNQKTKALSETNKDLSASIKEVESARKKEEIAINRYADKIDKLKSKLNDDKQGAISQIKGLMALQKQYDSTSKQYENYQIRIDNVRSKSLANSRNLESSISDLVAKQSKLVESYDKNTAASKKYTSELNANKSAINDNKAKVTELTSSLDINQMTMQQLRKEAALLKNNLSTLIPGSRESIELQSQLDKINGRMSDVNKGTKSTSMSFRDLADKFNHYSGIVTVMAGVLIGFGLSVQNIIERNNKLVDAQTAVAKTVNMTKEEVEDLTKAFSDYDTRTSKIDLLKIAETGGRLGVGKAEIKDFVQEVDKANVALGDGFAGGVEAVTDTLGKLKGLYSETKDLNIATAINQIGSAMNELGANGAASEQNIGEFAMRLGSLPEKLKPTIAEALALGAAFEESGIDAERASTAYSSVIRTAAKDADKFAKVMNLSKQEVEALMNEDPLEFFLKFSEGAKGLDTTELAKMLDYLKLNDQYVISTMGSASENTDRFRASIQLSNKALSDATSLQEEFDKVNNNSAAIFEKVQKKLAGIFANESVAKGLNFLIEGFGKMIGAVDDADGGYRTFAQTLVLLTKLIVIGTVAIFSFNTAVALSNMTLAGARNTLLGYTVIQKAHNIYTQATVFVQNLVTAAYLRGQLAMAILTRNTMAQASAQMRLNMITAANPFALLITVIATLGAAYLLLSKRTDEVAEKQKVLNDVRANAAMAVQDEKSKLESLLIVARNEKIAKEDRLAAIKKLNEISPEYLGNLTLENLKTAEGAKLINDYIRALDRKAMAEALSSKRTELFKKNIEIKSQEIDPGWMDMGGLGTSAERALNKGNLKTSMSIEDAKRIDAMVKVADVEKELAKYVPLVQSAYKKRRDELRANFQQISSLNAEQKKYLTQNPDAVVDETKSTYNIPTGDEKNKNDKSKKESDRLARLKEQHDREMDQIAKQGEEAARLANQIALDITDAKIDAMEEGLEKEIAEINIQEIRKMEAIEKQKIGATDIAILQKKIDKAVGEDKKLFQSLMDAWLKNNEELEKEKLAQSEIFDIKRQAAQYKAETKRLGDIEKSHQTELGHLKRQHNEELATYQNLEQLKEGLRGRMDEKERQKISTWAEGKEALNKIYNKRELELQITHLEAMVKLYEGLDLGILTPAQRAEVMKFIDEAGNKIAEFRAKMAGEDQNDGKTKKKRGSGDANGKGGGIDIMGMSADGWDNLIEDIKIGTASATEIVSAAVGAMQSAFATYYQFVEMNEKRQLARFEQRTNQKKNALKKQLLEGYINQETYKKQTIAADQELDKKKAELELKSAKRQRIIKIAEIITATSLAIMQAYAQLGPIAGTVAAVLVGTLGAVQIATVMRTPLPSAEGYEDGFGMEYPMERAQDGKKFNVRRKRLTSGLVDRPTHFIAGENNAVEMVIDNPTWRSYPDELKRAIYSANARAKGYEGGFNTNYNTPKNTPSESNDDTMIMLIKTVGRVNDTLDKIEKNGIEAKIAKTARNGKEVEDMRGMYNRLNNKNKYG